MTFADVILPLSVDEFVRNYLGRQYLRIEGSRERFAHLIPWSDLNETIYRHRLAGRMNLVRTGTPVPPSEYLRPATSPHGSTIEPRALERRLRLGDTLVLNEADELFPEIHAIAESLGDMFRIPISANIYVGFRHWTGFVLHWDEHDTLILQIDGSKHWQVYEPTKVNPISRSRPQDMVRPTGPAVWEGLLNAGDVLYMPRGWWHVAEPVESASLHVTFGISWPTGLDFCEWLVGTLKDVDLFRANLPIYAGSAATHDQVERLARAWATHVTDEAVVRFLSWKESLTGRGLPPDLPDAARDVAVDASTPLVLVKGRRLVFEEISSQEIGFWSGGKFWRCDPAHQTALLCLNDRDGCSSDDLAERLPKETRSDFRIFLRALIDAGVICPATPSAIRRPVGSIG